MLFERLLDPDDPVDLQAVVERFLPLARGLAVRYAGRGEPLDDVFQVACGALLKAIKRCDVTRGVAFSSYAVPTIVGEIKRHLRDRTRRRRRPASQARHARRALSLETPHGASDAEARTLGELVGVDEQGFDRVDARVDLRALTRVLKHRDRLVLYLRFGEDLTQRAIGERIGVSQMQVSRILRSSIRQLGDRAEQSQWLDGPSAVSRSLSGRLAG